LGAVVNIIKGGREGLEKDGRGLDMLSV